MSRLQLMIKKNFILGLRVNSTPRQSSKPDKTENNLLFHVYRFVRSKIKYRQSRRCEEDIAKNKQTKTKQ